MGLGVPARRPLLLPLLVAGLKLLPESRDPNPGPIDPLSILAILTAMTALVWSIKSVAIYGFSLPVVAAVAVALLAGTWFVRRQLGRANPMLDVRLFTNPVFSGSVAANLLSVFSLVGFLFFVSQHLQLVSGRSPVEAGLVLLPGLVVTIVAGLLVVRLAKRFRAGHLVVAGLLLNAVGYALVTASGQTGSDLGLLAAFAILGAGVGMAETISNDLILSSVPATKAGAASAISETAYEVGSVLGTAVLGGLLTATYRGGVVLPTGLTPEQQLSAGRRSAVRPTSPPSFPPTWRSSCWSRRGPPSTPA
ncbi:MFS transporter [Tessaracoccus coleopterorum]|uniref:MFS transporter n=1 Tax=Tessaracoccus coleopterorum TaxID=2714950 RepID=UPI002F908492